MKLSRKRTRELVVCEESIGHGAYGEVFPTSSREYVVKRLDKNEEATQREREALILLEGHPNVIQVLGWYQLKSKEYLILPRYMCDLSRFVKERSGLSRSQARTFMKQLLCGITYCHSKNIVHRDIKPENILVDSSERNIVISDFGLARKLDTERGNTLCVATVWYRPPELVIDKNIMYTDRIDIWSAGCVYTEMLCGVPLFKKYTEKTILMGLLRFFNYLRTNEHRIGPDCPLIPLTKDELGIWKQMMHRNAGCRPSAAQLEQLWEMLD